MRTSNSRSHLVAFNCPEPDRWSLFNDFVMSSSVRVIAKEGSLTHRNLGLELIKHCAPKDKIGGQPARVVPWEDINSRILGEWGLLCQQQSHDPLPIPKYGPVFRSKSILRREGQVLQMKNSAKIITNIFGKDSSKQHLKGPLAMHSDNCKLWKKDFHGGQLGIGVNLTLILGDKGLSRLPARM